MEIKAFLAILGGFFIGCAFVYVRLRSGLTRREWQYFRAFHQSLLDGTYDDSEIERSEYDDEN